MKLEAIVPRIQARLRRVVDRLAHVGQRRRARERMQGRSRPDRLLVLCYGNICRSPYAAAVLRSALDHLGQGDTEVASAGLIGPDRPANAQASRVALQRGHDLSGHRSRLLAAADPLQVSLFLVMTHDQRDTLLKQFGIRRERVELLADFDAEDPPTREIEDPYGRSDDEFRRVFDQIDRSVRGLVSIWAEPRVPSGTDGTGTSP